mgnify:CR=1 FL=1
MNFQMITNYEDQPTTRRLLTVLNYPPKIIQVSDLVLANLAFAFGPYLNGLPGDEAYASEACKVLYKQVLEGRTFWNVVESLKD